VRIYGQWAGNPKGQRENPQHCVVEVWPPGFWSIPRQCQRKRGHGEGDLAGLLCAHHARQYAARQGHGLQLSIPKDEGVTP